MREFVRPSDSEHQSALGPNLASNKTANTKSKANLLIPLAILRRIGEGEFPKQIAVAINKSPQLCNYYIRKLERCGRIRLTTRSSIALYEPTEIGKKMLERTALQLLLNCCSNHGRKA
jgi:predicted transcriptional regulator